MRVKCLAKEHNTKDTGHDLNLDLSIWSPVYRHLSHMQDKDKF